MLSALRERKPIWLKWRRNLKNASRCTPRPRNSHSHTHQIHHSIPQTLILCRPHISPHNPQRSSQRPQLSTSPPHNNLHHISNNTTPARNDAKDRSRGARGAAPTTIGNVTNHTAQTNNHREVAVEEEESQQTPTSTNNPTEAVEEAQTPTSGTMAEEQDAA